MIMRKDDPEKIRADVPNTFMLTLALTCKHFYRFVSATLAKSRLFIQNTGDIRFNPYDLYTMKNLLDDLRMTVVYQIRDLPKNIGANIIVKDHMTLSARFRPFTIEKNGQYVAKMSTLVCKYWFVLEISGCVMEEYIVMKGAPDIKKPRFFLKDTLWYTGTIDTQGVYVAIKDTKDGRPSRVTRAAFRELVRAKITAVIDAHEY